VDAEPGREGADATRPARAHRSATPADAGELTEALDEYERDLQRLRDDNAAADVSVSSWHTLLLSVVRGHTEAQLEGELRWLDETCRRIAEFRRPSGPGS
jgi:hypothetical protein